MTSPCPTMATEEEMTEESADLNQVNRKLDSLKDLIVQRTLEEPHGPSEGQAIVSVDSPADLAIEVPHIEFILGDQTFGVQDSDLVVQTVHSIIQLTISPKSERQQHQ